MAWRDDMESRVDYLQGLIEQLVEDSQRPVGKHDHTVLDVLTIRYRFTGPDGVDQYSPLYLRRKQVNTVDVATTVNVNATFSLARGTDGVIWCVYRRDTGRIYVAFSSDGGNTWTEELASADSSYGTQGGTAIMVDSSDVPHIIWHNLTGTDTIVYNDRTGGSWQTEETVYTSGGNIVHLAACIDSGNTFHMSFVESTIVYWITGTSGSWSAKETIDADGGGPTAITVDSNDIPFVVYQKDSIGGPSLRHRTGGTWSAAEEITTVDSDLVYPYSIAMDSSDDLHVAWSGSDYTDTGGEIRYRKRTSGTWGTDTQIKKHPTDDQDMGPPALMLDSDDNVIIVYQQSQPSSGGDEGVYFKKITGGTVRPENVLDPNILRPGNQFSVYAGLWAAHPSSSIRAANLQPIIVIADEVTSTTAKLLFYGGIPGSAGTMWVEGT